MCKGSMVVVCGRDDRTLRVMFHMIVSVKRYIRCSSRQSVGLIRFDLITVL